MRTAYSHPAPPPAPASPPLTGQDVARRKVRELLSRSAAFRALPPEKQRAIARNTAEIATYLAAPDGIAIQDLAQTAPPAARAQAAPARRADPYAFPLTDEADLQYRTGDASTPGENQQSFRAQGAREGAAVAGALLNQVNFVDFVSGLIDGVFNSIVDSTIRQMEAYGELVANVSKSLSQFRDENVSVNQGRDHLVNSFPDLFEVNIGVGGDAFFGGGGLFGEESAEPRVGLREGVDTDEALRRLNASDLTNETGPLDRLDDAVIEEVLVTSARNQLARSRHQLLATMVTMGINRIVVTDGKIQAKVLYDFQATDNYARTHTATNFDYDPTLKNVTTVTDEWDEGEQYPGETADKTQRQRRDALRRKERDESGGSRWSKGMHSVTKEKPVLRLISVTNEASDAALQTRASLAGNVEVNFKSDHIPLDKIADNFQIGMIQAAAKPGNGGTGGRGVVPARGAAPSPGTTEPAPPTPTA